MASKFFVFLPFEDCLPLLVNRQCFDLVFFEFHEGFRLVMDLQGPERLVVVNIVAAWKTLMLVNLASLDAILKAYYLSKNCCSSSAVISTSRLLVDFLTMGLAITSV